MTEDFSTARAKPHHSTSARGEGSPARADPVSSEYTALLIPGTPTSTGSTGMFLSPCSGYWDLLCLTLTLLTTGHDLIQTKVILLFQVFSCSCSGLFVKLPAMVLPLIIQLSLNLFPHRASTKLSSCKFCQLWL